MRSQGRLAEARVLYEQALSIALEVGHRRLEGYMLGDLGALRAAEGRRQEAESFFEQALVILRELGATQYVARVLVARAALRRRATGDLAGALAMAEEAAGLAAQSGDLATHASCVCEQAHVVLAQGGTGRPGLESVREAVLRLGVGAASELGQAFARLERAVLGAEGGLELFQGELAEDVPAGLLHALRRDQEI